MIQLALRMGKVMMPRNAWNAYALQAAFRLLSIVPPARNYFGEMKYKPKPRFNEGFLAREGKDSASALVGRLFPQPKVRSADRECLLDEFLGNGFALVSLPQTPPKIFDRLPADLWLPLDLRRVAVRAPGDTSFSPNGVTGVVDVEGDFSSSVKSVSPGLVLIRPDRYAAAFLPAVNLEAGIREVNELIARSWTA
jgi:3-(3-hydroxy-phenyl)propionate hydroxylase